MASWSLVCKSCVACWVSARKPIKLWRATWYFPLTLPSSMLRNYLEVKISLRFKSLTSCFCLNSISCIMFSSSYCFSLFWTGSMSMYGSPSWRSRPLAFSRSFVCESHCSISSSYFLCGAILIFFNSNISLYYCIRSALFTCPSITLLSDCKSTNAMKH